MMKRSVATVLIALCAVFMLTGCFEETVDSHYNITIEEGSVYISGEQSLIVAIADYSGYKTTFKDTITKDDIKLGSSLNGKEIKSVTYRNEKEIEIVIAGDCAETASDDLKSTITVSHSAMANDANAVCNVIVHKPTLTASAMTAGSGTVGTFVSLYSLPYGSFSENVAEYVELPDDNGTLTVEMTEDGRLRVRVENFDRTDDSYPVVHIQAEATSFNVEIFAYVGVSTMSIESGYPLTK